MCRSSLLSLRTLRRTILITIVLASAAFAAGALAAPWAVAPSAARAAPAQVLLVGDSIAAGMKPFLGEMIADREITFDVVAGRTTPQGMRAMRKELQRLAPQTIVINLGTNDGSDPVVFADRIRRTMRALPAGTCVVWSAITRPPRKGEYRGLNRVLRQAARHDRRVTVLAYDRMVAKGTLTLREGLHPTVEGARFLSYVTAAAVRRGCGGAPAA